MTRGRRRPRHPRGRGAHPAEHVVPRRGGRGGGAAGGRRTSPHVTAPRGAGRRAGGHRRRGRPNAAPRSATSPRASSSSPSPASPRRRASPRSGTSWRARVIDGDVGVHGLPTAFLAEAPGTSDGPTVAILAEYDALPGVGHACGHHLIAAAPSARSSRSAARGRRGAARPDPAPRHAGRGGRPARSCWRAAGALRRRRRRHDGRIRSGRRRRPRRSSGRRIARVTYHGVAAHASASPFMGRNALDAVALNYQAVAMLRQHLPPSDRVHGVVLEGGTRPSVVPERADRRVLRALGQPGDAQGPVGAARRHRRGRALATGTTAELVWDAAPFTLPVRTQRAARASAGPCTRRARAARSAGGGVVPRDPGRLDRLRERQRPAARIHPVIR